MSGEERPPIERRLPPVTPPQIAQPQVVSLETLTYQVGSVQSQLTHGLESLNRTLERGLDNVDRRLLTVESATNEIQRTLVSQNARLDALEEFRREAEAIETKRRDVEDTERRLAVDQTATARIWRVLATVALACLTAAGIIISIIAATGGLS